MEIDVKQLQSCTWKSQKLHTMQLNVMHIEVTKVRYKAAIAWSHKIIIQTKVVHSLNTYTKPFKANQTLTIAQADHFPFAFAFTLPFPFWIVTFTKIRISSSSFSRT